MSKKKVSLKQLDINNIGSWPRTYQMWFCALIALILFGPACAVQGAGTSAALTRAETAFIDHLDAVGAVGYLESGGAARYRWQLASPTNGTGCTSPRMASGSARDSSMNCCARRDDRPAKSAAR